MYKVINFFTDLLDNNHAYNVGDIFPREGVKVSQARIDELSGYSNKQRKPLIEKVAAAPEKQDGDTAATATAESKKTGKAKKA